MGLWSRPQELRQDLVELVGPIEKPTLVKDFDLGSRNGAAAESGCKQCCRKDIHSGEDGSAGNRTGYRRLEVSLYMSN